MNKFEVINCGEKRNYKPTYDNYLDALIRIFEDSSKNPNQMADIKKDKIMYLTIKMIGKIAYEIRDMSEREICDIYELVQISNGIIAQHTPREFMQIFPISKEYDGEKYGCKDYFSCMESIKEKGIDKPIGEDVFSFLWDYVNYDTRFYVVAMTNLFSAMSINSGGSDPVLDFLFGMGVPSYTHYESEGIMVNNLTGDVVKLEKPKKRIPKYLKVVGEE